MNDSIKIIDLKQSWRPIDETLIKISGDVTVNLTSLTYQKLIVS